MGATPSISATKLSPPAPRSTISPPKEADPATEVEQSFREFRESAVRLVERVNDLTGTGGDPVATARGDVRLVRSIFGKWSAEILVALHAVPSVGFEELRRSLPGISPRVLSLKLKGLEQNGMVHREIIDSRPPRVRYALTDRGWTVAWLAHPVFLYLRHAGLPSLEEEEGSESDGDNGDL
jgi:DNA-binding HxlR family transcriptional regulator